MSDSPAWRSAVGTPLPDVRQVTTPQRRQSRASLGQQSEPRTPDPLTSVRRTSLGTDSQPHRWGVPFAGGTALGVLVTAILLLARGGDRGSPFIEHEQAVADEQLFRPATQEHGGRSLTPPGPPRPEDKPSSSLTLHTSSRTSDQAFSSAVASLELCQARARELAGQCYLEDGVRGSALPDGTGDYDAACMGRLRGLHKELQQLQNDAGQAVNLAKQAFSAKEREFQELLGECHEKVAHATKVGDMRVADAKSAGKIALNAKQREVQDLKSDCEHSLANAARALAEAVEKEKRAAKAEMSKLEVGWERERKASAWDIQQLRGEADTLATGKHACQEALEQSKREINQRQAALDDKMSQVKAAEERITQLSEDLRTCQTASRTLSQALDLAERELAEHRAGPQEHLVAIASLSACRQTIDELRQCPGIVETTKGLACRGPWRERLPFIACIVLAGLCVYIADQMGRRKVRTLHLELAKLRSEVREARAGPRRSAPQREVAGADTFQHAVSPADDRGSQWHQISRHEYT